ncbi:MAG: ribosome biogenesis GTPase Der [Tepidisphaeraceae bacterium]|jgi:GTP-binding protein
MSSLPVVAIVGRPNVGKSSLLNALAGRRISIVQDSPGVTRDRVGTPLEVDGRFVEIMDTGGWGFDDPDQLTEHIQHQIELAVNSAELVLLVVDCQSGLTGGDEELSGLLRNSGVKTVLLANKADGTKADPSLAEFARLGWGTPIGISAANGRNIELVIDAIRQNIDLSQAPTELPPPKMLMAIVGKRNAGKSTLVNAIAAAYEKDEDKGERVIVSEVPGTTRDSVDVRFEKDGQTLIVIDTAGVRKKRHVVTNDIEFYGFHRAQRSIRRADVTLMLIDAAEPVSEPDKKLARYIAEQFKPVVLVVNKWDLARQAAFEERKEFQDHGVDDAKLMAEYKKYLGETLVNLDFAPIAFITASEQRNVQTVLDLAQGLYNQAGTRLTTGHLNRVVRQIMEERLPSTPSGRKARIYYATQTAVNPPTIVLFVNNPLFLDDSYRRFMLNRFRELLPYSQTPIKLLVRGRTQRSPTVTLDEATEMPGDVEAQSGAEEPEAE